MRELLNGCRIEAVAARLGIAEGTAKFHRHELYLRLGVSSQAQLMGRYMTVTDEGRRLIDGA
jgi:DNA-binding NarL/FixJ family response regulator